MGKKLFNKHFRLVHSTANGKSDKVFGISGRENEQSFVII